MTIATTLVSLLTGRLVRTDLVSQSCSFVEKEACLAPELLLCSSFDNSHSLQAMTGEISLHGLVLPVGGVRDKVKIQQRMTDQLLLTSFKSLFGAVPKSRYQSGLPGVGGTQGRFDHSDSAGCQHKGSPSCP